MNPFTPINDVAAALQGRSILTRRQRMLNIIENFGGIRSNRVQFHLDGLMAKEGLGALTDSAVENLAERIVSGHRHQQKLNRENRARVAG